LTDIKTTSARTSALHPLEATWHLLNLFVPAVGLGLLAAAGTKLLWRRETAGRHWWGLAWRSSAAGACVTLGGLAWFGQDGRMATYAVMIGATALTLWWQAFLRRG
jgi:hypothetical protein